MTSPETPPEWFTDIWQLEERGFAFEKYLGGGLRGKAWRFREVAHNEQDRSRRFVIKYTHNAGSLVSVEKEIRFAKRLYGQAHIAQLIVDGSGPREPLNIPKDTLKEQRTFLVSEYLVNGELQRFQSKANERRFSGRNVNPIPNRVLWFIFKCLARAVLALAYVPNRPLGSLADGQTVLEAPGFFEPATATHYQIYHADLKNHLGNLMFGEYDAGEHYLVPVLKAIDFSEATDTYDEFISRFGEGITGDTLTQGNIRDIGIVIQSLYGHSSVDTPAKFFKYNKNLDEEIYYLATRCADPDHTKRPGVNELYNTVHNATLRKTGPEHFPGKRFAQWESDNKIREFMNDVLHTP
ncbi:hypothetical protein E0Z10_g1126 [Xylaria hypoxylon]|uniref:Protein kinase domain-containing protein n=1 Tax=Xylaria hypoxylon TaxID=37992 RepID=A0A4Z0Z5Y3_9PEZI|nr:hypothetical protein E0Z10_g1126 [Xylaria hypoxylon]